MQEFSIWLVVGILWGALISKVLSAKTDDPIGQSFVAMLMVLVYIFPAIGRFIYLMIAAWL